MRGIEQRQHLAFSLTCICADEPEAIDRGERTHCTIYISSMLQAEGDAENGVERGSGS
jgi:hypothetical protein